MIRAQLESLNDQPMGASASAEILLAQVRRPNPLMVSDCALSLSPFRRTAHMAHAACLHAVPRGEDRQKGLATQIEEHAFHREDGMIV